MKLLEGVIKERVMTFLTLPPVAEQNVDLRGRIQAAVLDHKAETT